MSKASDFLGGARKIASIVNEWNVASAIPYTSGQPAIRGCKKTLSGSLTANTLATGLSLSGKGCINFAALAVTDVTSRTIRIKLTIDGVAVFDPGMSAAVTVTNSGIVAVGTVYPIANVSLVGPVFQPLYFSSSCLIEIASSLTETGSLALHVNYELHA